MSRAIRSATRLPASAACKSGAVVPECGSIEPKLTESDVTNVERRQKRLQWLRTALKPLSSAAIGRLSLDKLTSESMSDYSIHRESEGLSIGTINRELRVLRRILRLAVEWNVLEKSPKVSMAGNEPFRVRVVGDAEFERYLLHASPLLSDVATILHDSGLRPDELHRLCWEDINFQGGRNGALSVRSGKTAAARRTLPMAYGTVNQLQPLDLPRRTLSLAPFFVQAPSELQLSQLLSWRCALEFRFLQRTVAFYFSDCFGNCLGEC